MLFTILCSWQSLFTANVWSIISHEISSIWYSNCISQGGFELICCNFKAKLTIQAIMLALWYALHAKGFLQYLHSLYEICHSDNSSWFKICDSLCAENYASVNTNGTYKITTLHINGLVQDCSYPIANALELLQSCAKPFTWTTNENRVDLFCLKMKNVTIQKIMSMGLPLLN